MFVGSGEPSGLHAGGRDSSRSATGTHLSPSGTVPAGRVDDQPWAFWDLMPTFVELSGITPPEGYETDDHSLVEYLKGGEAPKRNYFYRELHLGNRPIQAARFGDWKAVRNGIDKPIEIYDLTKDAH